MSDDGSPRGLAQLRVARALHYLGPGRPVPQRFTMALKAIIATLVLGSSSLALAETPRQARVEHRIHQERGELRADRRVERRIGRHEGRVERRSEHRRVERGVRRGRR
jgi:hypothetical protein